VTREPTALHSLLILLLAHLLKDSLYSQGCSY
jgi:hypothetical protein